MAGRLPRVREELVFGCLGCLIFFRARRFVGLALVGRHNIFVRLDVADRFEIIGLAVLLGQALEAARLLIHFDLLDLVKLWALITGLAFKLAVLDRGIRVMSLLAWALLRWLRDLVLSRAAEHLDLKA